MYSQNFSGKIMKKIILLLILGCNGLHSSAQKHDMYLNNLTFGLGATPGMPQGFENYETGINFKFEPSYFLTHARIYVGISMEASLFKNREDSLATVEDYNEVAVITPSILVGRKLWVGNHLRFFPVLKIGYTFLNYNYNSVEEDLKESGFNVNAEFYTHFYPGRKLGFGFYGSLANAFIVTKIKNPDNKKVMSFGSVGLSLIYEMNWF